MLVLLISCGLLAACGGDDDAPAPAAAAADGAFPVTVESQLGSAEIEAAPERVVALDFSSADTAIALGVVPVAIARVDWTPDGLQPWTAAALGDAEPELLATTDGIPVEEVAAQRPDVILATNTYGLDRSYELLARIAPVVAWQEGEGVDTWQASTERIGRALGREERARELVAGVESRLEETAAAHPAFAGSTISFFNYVGSDAWVINSRDDFSIRFLEELGFGITPEVEAMKGAEGRAQVSRERFDVLEADVVMGTSPDPEALRNLEDDSVFRRQDFARRDAFISLDLPTATSMAFPSPLSIPYGVDEIVPKLAQVVA